MKRGYLQHDEYCEMSPLNPRVEGRRVEVCTCPIGDIVVGESNPSQPQPKPRLGDYYAGLDNESWDHAIDGPVRLSIAVRLAWSVFRELEAPETADFWLYAAAKASVAFNYGGIKHGLKDWRDAPFDDHFQATGRHLDAYLKEPAGLDPESGHTHEEHFFSRAIMCLEMRRVGK